MTDLAARVTTGAAMPDGSSGLDAAAGVLLLSAEDGIGDTIRADACSPLSCADRSDGGAPSMPTPSP